MQIIDPYQLFADQFEPDAKGDFVYRRSLRGAPIPVSEAERDLFLAAFERARRRLRGAMVAGVVAILSLLVAWSIWRGQHLSDAAVWLALLLPSAVYLFVWHRIWNAPAIALERRATVGRPLSREETRRAMLAKMTWPQMGGMGIVMIAASVRAMWDNSGFARWAWAAFTAVGAITWIILAVRKWRLERGC